MNSCHIELWCFEASHRYSTGVEATDLAFSTHPGQLWSGLRRHARCKQKKGGQGEEGRRGGRMRPETSCTVPMFQLGPRVGNIAIISSILDGVIPNSGT